MPSIEQIIIDKNKNILSTKILEYNNSNDIELLSSYISSTQKVLVIANNKQIDTTML